jgi:TonB family protein
MKRLLLIFSLVVLSAANAVAQDVRCPLRLEVVQNDGQTKIENTEAVITNLKTANRTKAKMQNGMPYFADLVEGSYSVTVSKKDYKSTIKRIRIICPAFKNTSEVSQDVLMWSGSPKEKVHFIDYSYERGFFDEVFVNDLALKLVRPEYPPAARAVRATGTVVVKVTVDEQGNVVSAQRVSGHPLLALSAVSSAKKSKFVPSMTRDKTTTMTGLIVYNFVP